MNLKEERTLKMFNANRAGPDVIRTMFGRRRLQRESRRSLPSLELLASF